VFKGSKRLFRRDIYLINIVLDEDGVEAGVEVV
jgi:hypothetical protein